jgi:hypothetical protein
MGEDKFATWRSLKDGEWGILIPGDRVPNGTVVTVKRRDGSTSEEIVGSWQVETEEGNLYEVDHLVQGRITRAENTHMQSINHKKRTAKFIGRKGDYYSTSLSGCTCPDQRETGKPCKHMYRLRSELENQINLVGEPPQKEPKKPKAKRSPLSRILQWLGIGFIIFIIIGIIAVATAPDEVEYYQETKSPIIGAFFILPRHGVGLGLLCRRGGFQCLLS